MWLHAQQSDSARAHAISGSGPLEWRHFTCSMAHHHHEIFVIAILRILGAFCDGNIGVACLALQIGGNACSVLVLLFSNAPRKVDDITFFDIIHGCSFECLALFIAYLWSSRLTGLGSRQHNASIRIDSQQGIFSKSLNPPFIDKAQDRRHVYSW